MNIGQAAEQLGIHVQTIRFYEREGLLPPLPRTRRGYRVLDAATMEHIRFIQHAQEAGFTLREVADLLALRAAPDGSCEEVQAYVQTKIEELDQRMEKLQSMKQVLEDLAVLCVRGLPATICPILEALHHSPDR